MDYSNADSYLDDLLNDYVVDDWLPHINSIKSKLLELCEAKAREFGDTKIYYWTLEDVLNDIDMEDLNTVIMKQVDNGKALESDKDVTVHFSNDYVGENPLDEWTFLSRETIDKVLSKIKSKHGIIKFGSYIRGELPKSARDGYPVIIRADSMENAVELYKSLFETGIHICAGYNCFYDIKTVHNIDGSKDIYVKCDTESG